MVIEVNSEQEMRDFGVKLGRLLSGGEVIELVGDVGSGKTTLVKGIAKGLDIDDDVQSPSFTISRVYRARDGLALAHYDFYRLNEAGIMKDELSETVQDSNKITAIEWGRVVEGVLPADHITIEFDTPSQNTRRLKLTGDEHLLEKL